MSGNSTKSLAAVSERRISLGPGLAAIPERLLLAHARGEVLFIAGAGVSLPSGLPDFRGLVVEIYSEIDGTVHQVISAVPRNVCNQWIPNLSSLNDKQAAEVKRFISGDYDVVLGMLERRMEGEGNVSSSVRRLVSKRLRMSSGPASTHKSLMRLSDRGGVTTVVTTNFDLLLEEATSPRVETYSLGGVPRPGRRADFAGVLHIHGALDRNANRPSDFILSDQDFGEFYLRRRVVPDFIYDAARLFNLVLVGYSANDPPMRYLLNAVAADGTRFSDIQERFSFVAMGEPDPIALEDWSGRGITPISYDSAHNHQALEATLRRWADLSVNAGKKGLVDKEIRRIVKSARATSSDSDRDLFDHLVRRGNKNEREHISDVASKAGADFSWLDAIRSVIAEAR